MNLQWEIKALWSRLRNSSVILARAPFAFENWLYFLASRFSADTGILRLRNGLRFKIRPRSTDRSTVSEVFILKTYDREDLGYRVRPDDIVLDVGANIGAFALRAAHEGAARVYALEPAADAFECLRENAQLNQCPNLLLFNLAMDATDGVRELYLAGAMSSFYWSRDSSAVQTVTTTSLETFLQRLGVSRVDFLKMDCEGAEFDIVLNTDAGVFQTIHRIALEFHNLSPEKNAGVLKADLEAKGFRVDVVKGSWNGILLACNTCFTVPAD